MPSQKKKKVSAKKFLVTIIIGFVAVAFVGSFAYNYTAKRGNTTNIAVINGETVSMGSDSLFANLYRQYYEEERQKSEGEGITEEKNRQLLRRALDSVIQRTLILQYAEKEGIKVSRDTVLASIIDSGYYATPGRKFDEKRYNNTPESDKQRIFQSEEEQLIIGIFLEDFINTAKTSDVELESFYNYTNYGKKIEYVFIRYDDLPEAILRSFYNENPKLFEKAHAAHILIKDDAQKANQLYEELQKAPDQFEQRAKEESEDPTSEKGGDLDWFYRNEMVPEFSEVAFGLKKGEISPPVKTVFGYHIIKALDSVQIQDFDEALYRVKKEYVISHREEVEKEVGLKSREIIEKVSRDPQAFEKTALAYGLRAEKTDFITIDGQYILNEDQSLPLFELMNIPSLVELVFSTEKNSVGGPVKTSDGEIIFKVIEEKEFDRAEYEKVRDYLKQFYTNLKENYIFNDWYLHALRKSKITDNFDTFFTREG